MRGIYLEEEPEQANPGWKSPLQTPTKRTPDLSEILVFGSPCTVFRVQKNAGLAR